MEYNSSINGIIYILLNYKMYGEDSSDKDIYFHWCQARTSSFLQLFATGTHTTCVQQIKGHCIRSPPDSCSVCGKTLDFQWYLPNRQLVPFVKPSGRRPTLRGTTLTNTQAVIANPPFYLLCRLLHRESSLLPLQAKLVCEVPKPKWKRRRVMHFACKVIII